MRRISWKEIADMNIDPNPEIANFAREIYTRKKQIPNRLFQP
jgi:hypothetical protein